MKMASKDASPSTDGAANLVPESQQEVLALQPVAGAQIAAPVAGQFNVIDPWIYQNFVQAPEGEFTVSPRNSTGEILMNLELGPQLNPYLAHLARMYNAYAGGFEVQVLLAGNAFTAGKIIVCAVPPNFPLQNISAAQATQLPHVVVDVRQLEPVVLPLPDVRAGFYHYNQVEESRMRLVAILYTPLRTNSAGDDAFTVSCRILTRPAPDFSFFFLIPPTIESKTTPFTLPRLPISEMTNSRFPLVIKGMVVDPNLPLQANFQNGRITLDGELQGTTLPTSTSIGRISGTYMSSTPSRIIQHEDSGDSTQPRVFNPVWMDLTENNWTEFQPFNDQPAPLGCPDFKAKILGTLIRQPNNGSYYFDAYLDTRQHGTFAPYTGHAAVHSDQQAGHLAQGYKIQFSPTGIESDQNTDLNQLPDYGGAMTVSKGLAPAAAPDFPGEMILYFVSDMPVRNPNGERRDTEILCLLPQEMVTHFYEQQAPSQGDVALVRYINAETGRVMFEGKLHRNGFFTVSATARTLIVPDGYFRFDSWVNRFYTLSPMGTGNGRRRARMLE
ncbi:capsid protein VP1 [Norovirus Hu/GVIII/2-18/Tokyo/1986/JPN]|uniref:Capsid protein n=2 Tax=Norwalk virus TaxID=11983 RepID=Q3V574_NORV|nr:capsid protein VP1 [Norovirus Hu/GVIII/2-18/Tokyo/1986/JPN]CAH59620.1 capsid protein [Chiba-040502 virus]